MVYAYTLLMFIMSFGPESGQEYMYPRPQKDTIVRPSAFEAGRCRILWFGALFGCPVSVVTA